MYVHHNYITEIRNREGGRDRGGGGREGGRERGGEKEREGGREGGRETYMITSHFKGLPVNVLNQFLLPGHPPVCDVRILSFQSTQVNSYTCASISHS